MKLFDILRLHIPDLQPTACKVHLAVSNGFSDPFEVFRQGEFPAWQAWQSRKNFERPVIVSLIRMPGSPHCWLFAGCFRQIGVVPHPQAADEWLYETVEMATGDIAGRLIVDFRTSDRSRARLAETIHEDLVVAELRARPVSNVVFESFQKIRISKAELDLIVRRKDKEWSDPLSSILGIYVITDTKNGKLYVGSAGADTERKAVGGIWSRWSDYSRDGHGDDVRLKRLLEENGSSYADNFQYSIIQVMEPQARPEAVKEREGHWKRVLGSYHHGYNGNIEADVERSY